MSEISKKDALARNMLKMQKLLPQEFDFVPRSWIMPSEYSSLVAYGNDAKKTKLNKTFIMKPANGAMGHGIKLYRNVDTIQPMENYIVQEYITNPYLLDGFKFDLRIYVLVTSCDPLRAFIYNNGLVRLGTEEYQEPNESNMVNICVFFKVILYYWPRVGQNKVELRTKFEMFFGSKCAFNLILRPIK